MSTHHIEPAIINILRNDLEVSKIVGNRIYVEYAGTKSYPLIVIEKISGTHRYTQDGRLFLASDYFAIKCFSESLKESRQLEEAVVDAVDNYHGLINATEITSVMIEDRSSEIELIQGNDKPIRLRVVEIKINYRDRT